MKLGQGPGSIDTKACWMSLAGWLSGETKWGDEAPCVDRAIRELCIFVNDYLLTDEDRERVIGPHVYAVMGTMTKDPDTIERRKLLLLEVLRQQHVLPTGSLGCSLAGEVVNSLPGWDAAETIAHDVEFILMPLILKMCAVGTRAGMKVRNIAELKQL